MQNVEKDGIYFMHPILQKFNGTKMKHQLSINDISLTCVVLKNVIEIQPIEDQTDTSNSKETAIIPHIDKIHDIRINQEIVTKEHNI